MSGYRGDRAYSDAFIPAIKQIVGPLLLEPASLELDNTCATDLVVMKAKNLRIAARVRRQGFAERYPGEFTIRCRRDNGRMTELSKIMAGWGDWFFYGHALPLFRLTHWLLVDLDRFRSAVDMHNAKPQQHRLRWGIKPNGDGTHFAWFDARSFPPNPPILIASWDTQHANRTA